MSDAIVDIEPEPAAADASLMAERVLAAEAGGLRYVADSAPGFNRKRTRSGFRYLDAAGNPLKDPAELARIKSLAIPPAWTDVWICRDKNGHLQATGRDARGRKQYRYHKNWREVRDEAKYERMVAFATQLSATRARLEEDIRRPGLSREKVIATIIRLLDVTMIRVGNEEYAQANKSFGLTTLRNRHVTIDGAAIEFNFKGKSGISHNIRISEPRLARIVRRMRELPGQELFQYVDSEGARHSIGSADVNDYLKTITGENYTAKDFRTWSGTVQTVIALKALGPAETLAEAKQKTREAIETAANKLGNTPTICRKCYVHPTVLEAYANGDLHELMEKKGNEMQTLIDKEEAFTLELLQHALMRQAAT
ncbi:DNA topoisomerase I [Methylobacillus sp. MM3]|uniref:DNA topoisomerase IB n=1 Tax=Methylobacillus sp. MM3 TaxID=1848039 RepID=UPI0007E299E6|nr:DNA topoisomerase IB [Methylobacillus sp. MM3]OAJ70217.1 DNA topoisomerase I [Methylobacillus sp. MM3]